MKVLISSPHLDDEVLGCSSWIAQDDIETHVVYTTRKHPQFPQVLYEAQTLHLRTGIKPHWTSFDRINELDLVGQSVMIDEFESVLAEVEPDVVLVPAPSYNQDHRAVWEAMLTACRPHDHNFVPKRVLAYEEVETWGTLRRPHPFQPTYFRALDLEHKLDLYAIYDSQIRAHRSMLDIEAVARVRGLQAGLQHAEAFEVLRWVE